MPYATFALYNALGAVCWSAIFGTLGYLFASHLSQLEPCVGRPSLAVVLLLALVVGLVLAWRWFVRNRARLVGRAQAWRQHLLAAPALRRLRARYPRVWTLVAARFAPEAYLRLHLTLGVVVRLSGLWGFWAIQGGVNEHDPLTLFAVRLLNCLPP